MFWIPSRRRPPNDDGHGHSLQVFLRQQPGWGTARVRDCLRYVPGKRAIYRITTGKSDLIVKQYFGPNAPDQAKRSWAELLRIHPAMMDGPFRVPEPVEVFPSQGIVATEMAEGSPLSRVYRRASHSGRQRLVHMAAEWYQRYLGQTVAQATFPGVAWLRAPRQRIEARPTDAASPFAQDVLAELTELTQTHAGARCLDCIPHGDFHGANLLFDGRVLSGIDIGGSHRLPVVKDIARFAVATWRLGVPDDDTPPLEAIAAIAAPFVKTLELDPFHQDVVLRFFIGFELINRLPSPASDADVLALRAFLAAPQGRLRA